MDQFQKDINDLVHFDSLAEAERITGRDYKKDDSVAWLGMALMQENNDKKHAALRFTNDVSFDSTLSEYIAAIERMEFRRVFHKNFSAVHCGEMREAEQFVFWLDAKGILLHFDTYLKDRVNGGSFYYNIKWKDSFNWNCTSSGCCAKSDPNVWVGNHDCREAVKHHIGLLGDSGEFLTQWIERPFLWLLTWADSKVEGYDYHVINESVIAQLPPEVRKAITP